MNFGSRFRRSIPFRFLTWLTVLHVALLQTFPAFAAAKTSKGEDKRQVGGLA